MSKMTKDVKELCNQIWCPTELMKAMYLNDMVTFQSLLRDESYNVNEDVGGGWSILHAGAYLNKFKCVEMLIESDRLELSSFFTVTQRKPSMYDRIFKKVPDSLTVTNMQHTALHMACFRGNSDMIKLLEQFIMSKTIPQNNHSQSQSTPIHSATSTSSYGSTSN